jgi:hypothetical protein
VSAVALFKVGDELPRAVAGVGGTGAGLLVGVQDDACVVQGVPGPAITGKEERDVVACLPGSVDVPPGFFMLEGSLVMTERLWGVTRPPVDAAESILLIPRAW